MAQSVNNPKFEAGQSVEIDHERLASVFPAMTVMRVLGWFNKGEKLQPTCKTGCCTTGYWYQILDGFAAHESTLRASTTKGLTA